MPTLAAALATVASREPWLQVRAGEPRGAGWRRADRLLTAGSVDGLVTVAAGRIGREHPGAQPEVVRTVAAAVLLDHWAWALAVVGAGTLGATGEVPDLSPARLSLRVQDGHLTGVAVQRFADQRGEAGLRAELTAHLTQLHGLLCAGDAPLLRRSARLLLGGIGDAVATALSAQAGALSPADGGRLIALADRLLEDAPGWGRPGWVVLDDGVVPAARTRRRTSCCLWYRLPDQSACLSCPRLSDDRRAERLREAAGGPA